MAQVDTEKATELMKRMKADVQAIIDKYANEACALSVNSEDPHAPVIGCAQMALANAATDYMVTCGTTPLEGFSTTVNITGQAMQQWVNAVVKKHGLTMTPQPEGGPASAPTSNDTDRA